MHLILHEDFIFIYFFFLFLSFLLSSSCSESKLWDPNKINCSNAPIKFRKQENKCQNKMIKNEKKTHCKGKWTQKLYETRRSLYSRSWITVEIENSLSFTEMKVNCTKKKNLNKTKYLTNFIYTAALFLLLSWKKKKKRTDTALLSSTSSSSSSLAGSIIWSRRLTDIWWEVKRSWNNVLNLQHRYKIMIVVSFDTCAANSPMDHWMLWWWEESKRIVNVQ